MIHQPFDHIEHSLAGRHDDAAEFEARRRLNLEHQPPSPLAEIVAEYRAAAATAKATGDLDLYYVYLDEIRSLTEQED